MFLSSWLKKRGVEQSGFVSKAGFLEPILRTGLSSGFKETLQRLLESQLRHVEALSLNSVVKRGETIDLKCT